jgi:hypothetical protein
MAEDTGENQNKEFTPFRFRDHVKQAGFGITTEHTLNPHQYERTRRLLTWHNPPPEDLPKDAVDAIIVPGTSPIIDETGFTLRSEAGTLYGNKFPDAKMVVSGMRPDILRASEREKAPGYSEAKEVASEMERLGYKGKIELEEEAKHTGQNIVYSFDMLFGKADGSNKTKPLLAPTKDHVLVITTSSYSARRTDLYVKRELKLRGLEGKVKVYIYDADVAEDKKREQNEKAGIANEPLTEEARLRQEAMFLREAQGMSRYRQDGQI